MTSIYQHVNKTYGVTRREWLQLAASGALATSASGWLPTLAAQAATTPPERQQRPKSCILLWMSGGPSQVHTFNIPTEGPEYQTRQTAVNGIRISEYLPLLASQQRDMTLIRSMSTGINEHQSAHFLMHMGYRASLSVDYPSFGSVVSSEIGRRDTGLPNYICIGAGNVVTRHSRPGFLGANYAPLMTDGRNISNIRPAVATEQNDARLNLLDAVEQMTYEDYRNEIVRAHHSSYQRAVQLMRTERIEAFDVRQEPNNIQEMYGSHNFGKQCLLARRLVEAGVAFVEVAWGGHGATAWDSHGGGAEPVRRKSPELDQGFSALIRDLRERGMLDSTLVVWMGEFGRGPLPRLGGGNNTRIGSGHYARAWTTVLAGGGLQHGQVIGQTDARCVDVTENPVSAGDFFATICRGLGIDPRREIGSPGGRPHYITPTGSEPIAALF